MTPGHKMKIVSAYQANGSIVAMTGDGVNDAPALSSSDIGIAMGTGGSDVCKEAAEIILVDNNFNTIVAAIEQGKIIYNNIKNFLRFQLTTSIAAMGLVAVCSFLDWPLPLNATQILWINIIMDGPPAQSLTNESYADVHRIPPRDPKAPLVSLRIVGKICSAATIIVLGTLFVFLRDIPEDIGIPLHELNETPLHASTMAFTTFVFFQLFSAFNCRSLTQSVFQIGLFSNKVLLVVLGLSALVQLAVVYLPFLQIIFHTVPLSFSELVFCIAVSSLVWVVDEFIKMANKYK
jgi:Ca2+-transporting ATPase